MEEGGCDDILLFLPTTGRRDGRDDGDALSLMAEQLNEYLLAALVATYTDRAMVLLEPPHATFTTSSSSGAEGGGGPSWFDCPLDDVIAKHVKKDTPHHIINNNSTTTYRLPTGISRLVRHPQWLSRNCPVPCQSTYNFNKWNTLGDKGVRRVTCQNDDYRKADVFAMNGADVREHFENELQDEMSSRMNEEEASNLLCDWRRGRTRPKRSGESIRRAMFGSTHLRCWRGPASSGSCRGWNGRLRLV